MKREEYGAAAVGFVFICFMCLFMRFCFERDQRKNPSGIVVDASSLLGVHSMRIEIQMHQNRCTERGILGFYDFEVKDPTVGFYWRCENERIDVSEYGPDGSRIGWKEVDNKGTMKVDINIVIFSKDDVLATKSISDVEIGYGYGEENKEFKIKL